MRSHEKYELSAREQEVIEFAGLGMTDAETAAKLGISVSTVTTYWERIRLKFGVHRRTELVVLFERERYEELLEAVRAENVRLLTEQRDHEDHVIRELMEAFHEPVIVVDQDQTVRFANNAAAQLFGYSITEFVGPVRAILMFRDRDEGADQGCGSAHSLSMCPTTGESELAFARHRDGRLIPIQAKLRTLHAPDELLVMFTVQEAIDPVESDPQTYII